MRSKLDSKKKIFSYDQWYKQSAAVKPIYVGYPWMTCTRFTLRGKKFPISYSPFGVYFKNDFFHVYFPQKRMRQIAYYYFHREESKPGFINSLFNSWKRQQVRELEFSFRKIYSAKLDETSHAGLIKLFRDFSQVYTRFWQESIFLDTFDLVSDEILEQAVEKEARQPNAEQLHTLTSPVRLSWLQREKQDLVDLVETARHRPGLWRALKNPQVGVNHISRQWPDFVRDVERHSRRWHWIFNDYAVIRDVDWRYFMNSLRQLTRNKKLLAEEKRSLRSVTRMAVKKLHVLKKLRYSRHAKHVIVFLTLLSEWRDWRKVYTQKANKVVSMFAHALAERRQWAFSSVEQLWWQEALDFFALPKSISHVIKKRENGFFVFSDFHRPQNCMYGNEALQLNAFFGAMLKQKGNLSGRIAYRGRVKGVVRVIRSQKDFSKMRKGDILVAPNTRPEYQPIMKMASALVSEEGGLTCHTAIIARELKIAAVVGVQGVTSVLKDGDRVVVDATKGTVKKI